MPASTRRQKAENLSKVAEPEAKGRDSSELSTLPVGEPDSSTLAKKPTMREPKATAAIIPTKFVSEAKNSSSHDIERGAVRHIGDAAP